MTRSGIASKFSPLFLELLVTLLIIGLLGAAVTGLFISHHDGRDHGALPDEGSSILGPGSDLSWNEGSVPILIRAPY